MTAPQPLGPYDTGRFADVTPDQALACRTAEDVARLVERMRADWFTSGQVEWENPTMDRFLEALAAVVELEVGEVTWSRVAWMLVKATGYE